MYFSRIEGTTLIVDLTRSPFEFASPEFIHYHLRDLSMLDKPITKIIYEEEMVFELDEEKTRILIEYANFIKKVEELLFTEEIYGMKSDPYYQARKRLLREFYDLLLRNPLLAYERLEEYSEPYPTRDAYLKGYENFKKWKNGILKALEKTRMFKLVKEMKDMRSVFLSLLGMRSVSFIDAVFLELPKDAKPLKHKKARYSLPFGMEVQIYEVPGKDAPLYVIKNPVMENLKKEHQNMLKKLLFEEMRINYEASNYDLLFELKTKEYRDRFLREAFDAGIEMSREEAREMAREAVAWVFGLGSPIENIALDRENVTDIYVDGENVPIYIEHKVFGICHTLYRYNREMLERAFKNVVLSEGKGRKFDEEHPVIDIYLKRLRMRVHLQRPPATFGELQGAFRLMNPEPFTYAQYIVLRSMTPFFTGYDDLLVNLGSSEAVVGLKGTGKTALTAAKIIAIGTKKRIIPIQDIEEMPIDAFRKRGFHIGAARVQSSELEMRGRGELDLVTMANAILRMGEAALVINEVRSRVALQGIINLLTTQPGVFLLYNFHAESLQEIEDRLELVFGIPASSMFSTERYTVLKKLKFGRKSPLYRVIFKEYHSDRENRRFVENFEFKRGNSIEDSYLQCKFLRNKEASSYAYDVDFATLEKNLDINFIPPVIKKRADDLHVKPEQLILQAFFKGYAYNYLATLYKEIGEKHLIGLDMVLAINKLVSDILLEVENEFGEVDVREARKLFDKQAEKVVKAELERLNI